MKVKNMMSLVTPPVFVHLSRRLWSGRKSHLEWEYIPEGWAYAQAHPEVKGWNVRDVLETYKEKWPRYKALVQNTKPLGVAHQSDMATNEDFVSHNTIMSFAYVLALAAHKKNRLSILDWGGGIGHYYLLAQALLPDVEIEYHCKDVALLSEYGKELFPGQSFSTDEKCLDHIYDLVLASTSIHYTEDWQPLLERLAHAASDYVYIANLPTVQQAASFVFIQRPYKYGYNTEYLGWCLNRTEFLSAAENAGLELAREIVYGHQPFIHGAPEQNTYCGYLFRPNTRKTTIPLQTEDLVLAL